MATHSSILCWRIPWTEEPGGLWSLGSQSVEEHWNDLAHMYERKKKLRQIRGSVLGIHVTHTQTWLIYTNESRVNCHLSFDAFLTWALVLSPWSNSAFISPFLQKSFKYLLGFFSYSRVKVTFLAASKGGERGWNTVSRDHPAQRCVGLGVGCVESQS